MLAARPSRPPPLTPPLREPFPHPLQSSPLPCHQRHHPLLPIRLPMLPFCQWGSRGGCRGGSRSPILATSPISRTPLLRDGAVGDCCVEEDEVMSMGGGGEARRAMLMLLVAAVNNTRVPLKSSVLPAPRSLDGCKAARQEFDCATQDLSFSDYVLCFALARKVEEDKNSCTWICVFATTVCLEVWLGKCGACAIPDFFWNTKLCFALVEGSIGVGSMHILLVVSA